MLVLIIEDEILLANEWRTAFEAAGHRILMCQNVESGMTACVAEQPDAVVLDFFFKDEAGNLTGDGALTFTTRLNIHCYETGTKPPVMIGITASKPSDYFPIDVFAQLPKDMVVKRLRKPISPVDLVAQVEYAVRGIGKTA